MTDPTRAAAVAALSLAIVKADEDKNAEFYAEPLLDAILANPDHRRAIRAVTLTVEELAAAMDEARVGYGWSLTPAALHARLTEPTDTGSYAEWHANTVSDPTDLEVPEDALLEDWETATEPTDTGSLALHRQTRTIGPERRLVCDFDGEDWPCSVVGTEPTDTGSGT